MFSVHLCKDARLIFLTATCWPENIQLVLTVGTILQSQGLDDGMSMNTLIVEEIEFFIYLLNVI